LADDGSMDGALDEAECKWPSAIYQFLPLVSLGGSADLLGFCLVVRAKGMVGFRS